MLGAGEISNFLNTEIDYLIGLYGYGLDKHNEYLCNIVRYKLNYLPYVLKGVGTITETQEALITEKIKNKLQKVEEEKLWMVLKS